MAGVFDGALETKGSSIPFSRRCEYSLFRLRKPGILGVPKVSDIEQLAIENQRLTFVRKKDPLRTSDNSNIYD